MVTHKEYSCKECHGTESLVIEVSHAKTGTVGAEQLIKATSLICHIRDVLSLCLIDYTPNSLFSDRGIYSTCSLHKVFTVLVKFSSRFSLCLYLRSLVRHLYTFHLVLVFCKSCRGWQGPNHLEIVT